MTASTTEQERALADLRHMYAQMVGGMVKDSAQAKRIADGILSRAIQKLEQAARRAPAVPQVTPEMVAAAEDAYMPFGDMELAIQCALSAAPQPPEADHIPDAGKMVAAPVQMPEPVECQVRIRPMWDERAQWTAWDKCSAKAAEDYERVPVLHEWGYEVRYLYTEQQVRTILAQHGIKTK